MQEQFYSSTSAQEIRVDFEQAELQRLKLAAGSIKLWSYIGIFLSGLFLFLNSIQAFWALQHLAGLATDSTLNAVVTGLIAVSLILAANVVSIRLGSGMSRGVGVGILLGLMAFSVITSSLHLGFQVLGGHQASINQSAEYRMALQDFELARQAYSDVLASAAQADAEGDTRSSGWIRSRHAPQLKDAADAARQRLQDTKKTAGTEASILSTVAGYFGMNTEAFSTVFAVVSVSLMEAVRIFLAFSTASAVRQLIRMPVSKKPEPHLRAVA